MANINRRVFVAGALGASFASPVASQGSALAGKLTVTGSSTVAPLVLEIGKAFEKRHPRVRIDVQTGGSSRGIADARSGLSDIGMASRALTASEADLVGTPIARDGICLIAHKSNTISDLDDAKVVELFTGRITDWSAVGGKAGRVTVVNKAEGRSTLELFLQHYKLKPSDVKASVIIGDNAQGVKTVVANPGAIGYVSIGSAEFEVEQGTAIKLISMAGIKPSSAAVRDGTFPLSRPLTLITKSAPAGLVAAFLDFARSSAVHDLVKEQFFVPLQT
jgi:phosphate transport system substrate-binding protein